MAVVLSRNPPAQPMLHTANANRISASGMPDMPRLPQWRPRDGRTAAYHAWQHALQNAERDLGLRAEAKGNLPVEGGVDLELVGVGWGGEAG